MLTLSRFELGACAPLHIRREQISLGLRRPIRLLYASDLQLAWCWTNRVIATIQTHPTPGIHHVLCGHDPAIFNAACKAGYRLVLAGHLHGGQCVLVTWRDRLYPGAWFARWTGLRFHQGNTTMLVSRGTA